MYRILIADDEPIERMVLAKKLNQMFADQITVIQAENGKDAVEAYTKENCRIAILDINMPGMNGLEAARLLRKEDRDCILIFLTAYSDFDYARQAIAVQALDYLLKPGSDTELETAMEEALRLVQEQDAQRQERERLAGLSPEQEKLADLSQKQEKWTDSSPERQELTALDPDGNSSADQNVQNYGQQNRDDEPVENVRLKVISAEIVTYIDEHYQTDIALQDISGALGYSEAYFCKIFRQCFSQSFTGYLTEYRIRKAKELLTDIHVNIKDISTQVGIRDSNYFARVFKRNAGCTPSEYRNQVLSGRQGN